MSIDFFMSALAEEWRRQ